VLILSQVLFLLAALGVALASKAKANREDDHNSEYFVITLSALAAALAVLGQVTLDAEGSDSGTLLRILNNLAIYAGAPMLVTAIGAIAKNYPISRPAWGRWLLGLFALFELCRRMGYGESYTLVLGLCCLAGLLTSLIWFRVRAVVAPMVGGLAFLAAGFGAHYLATAAISLLLGAAGLALLARSLKNVPLQPRPE